MINTKLGYHLLDKEGILRYTSLSGSLQYVVSIGRTDIATTFISLSSYQYPPRIRQLEH